MKIFTQSGVFFCYGIPYRIAQYAMIGREKPI